MIKHFMCISIAFLLDRFHGRTLGDCATEWPPSPMRLFQSLVATAHRGRGEGPLPYAEEKALGWLESLCERQPPTIVAKPFTEAKAYVIAVPNNDLDVWARPVAEGREPKKQPNELRTMKTIRPSTIFNEPIEQREHSSDVRFIWSIDVTDANERAEPFVSIRRLVRRIVSVGWGSDFVAADARLHNEREVKMMHGTRWCPGAPLGYSPSDRPVPVNGTLSALRARHNRWLNRVNSESRQYNDVPPYIELDENEAPRLLRAYEPASALPTRPFAAFALRDPHEASTLASFSQHRSICVAAMLRHAAWEAAGNDLGEWRNKEWAEEFVAGHGPRKSNGRYVDESWARFSYLPLPSLTPIGVGDIRRVIIAEPFGGDGRSKSWAQRRLAGVELVDHTTRKCVAVLEPITTGDSVLHRYIRQARPARDWTTVTPVILPGYDDAKPAKRERLLMECLRHAGYQPEAIESIESRSSPWFPRVPLGFRRPSYLEKLPAVHVRLQFRESVTGPVSLGAGRHCGLGVFAIDSSA